MKIGQKVFLRPREWSNAHRRDRSVKTSFITKIGRKYITVEGYGLFEISNGRQKAQFNADYVMYFDENALNLKIEKENLISMIKKSIPTYGEWDIDIEKLRQIATILNCC